MSRLLSTTPSGAHEVAPTPALFYVEGMWRAREWNDSYQRADSQAFRTSLGMRLKAELQRIGLNQVPHRSTSARRGSRPPLATWLALLVGVCLSTVHGQGQAEHAHGTERSQEMFDPEQIKLGKRAPELAARELLEQEKFSAAADLLRAALPLAKTAAAKGRIRWLLADAYEGAQRSGPMRTMLGTLGKSKHPLAPRAQLRLAASLYVDSPKAALELLQPLQHGHAFSSYARLLRGLALRQAGRRGEAIAVLGELVDDAPLSSSAAGPALPLAELLIEQGTTADKVRALSLLSRVESRAPLSGQGKAAAARRTQVIATLPTAMQRRLSREAAEDAFARGEALMRSHAYSQAIETFEELAKQVSYSPALVCEAKLQQGRAMLRKRDRGKGAELMERLLRECGDAEHQVWIRYYAGQTYVRLGQPERALPHYDALAKAFPQHRLADDALYQAALAAGTLEDIPGMVSRLQRLLREMPDGDMRAEALFMLAWQARQQRDYRTAIAHFDEVVAHPEYESQEGTRGRAAYWRARTLLDMGQKRRAIEGYAQVVRTQRLGYHAQQALSRLRQLDSSLHQRLLKELSPGAAKPLQFPREECMGRPQFDAAIALLQVGATGLAEEELRFIGLLGSGASARRQWLSAGLFNAVGAYPQASAIARRHAEEFMALAPQGEALSKWRIAYPKAFAPSIERAAAEAKVPAAYVRAVAREESAFNPRAVSTAHAYGLIQLIRPTAKQYAKTLGLPSHPNALKNPRINLRIGSHFIRSLWERFEDNPAVVPAAYNAGPGAAERWIRAQPGLPLDEWVETIPYSETRRYTRRVLQTYGTYAFLDDGRFPQLPSSLPSLSP